MPEKDWEKLGELSEGLKAGAVAASREGFGLIGAVAEPPGISLLERMKARRAQIHRAAAGAVTKTWEGPGWIQALDCHGALGVAIGGSLKPSGSGSDYHLLVSTDGGQQWQGRGVVGAPSLGQVLAVSEREVWVLGAYFLGRTTDGGASWMELELEGERNPHTERLRRVEGGVALLGRTLSVSTDGGSTWSQLNVGAARVVDVDGAFVAAVVDGQARVGERQGSEVRWLEPLPLGREPLRLVASEGTLRLLTRGVDPSKGPDPALHVSEDGGRTWASYSLPLGPQVDIAGREWGLGVDIRGGIYGRVG
ncbi:neuraminidase [Archangium sp. Cb G35]|uniref:WD40/YVTN/BNR-like repeat-containing protein n=1 Tax=Archangium sp. Cb G35 TaxID=1920190 RepID=UPI0009357CE7|nr:neuraminidase [Archangium sp. Cb G35]OJT18765.1 neuraminidase [Archangium sp. Cb G35]